MTRNTLDITIPLLRGRRAIVTGGSDGIGLQIATRLARAGADIVLPVRSMQKGETAVDRIRAAVPDARIDLAQMDLSSLESVAHFGETLRADGRPVHILINNAGIMTPPARQATEDGFELQFGTNHLGHFALVAQLFPLLRAGGARVTSQVSVAANERSINWDDLQWERSYNTMNAYSQSKIALGLFAAELARRSVSERWGITSNLSHPGIAPTSLLSARPELGRARDTLGVRVIRWASSRGLIVGTPETAALPAVYAAASAEARTGGFYAPSGFGHLGGAPGEQRLYSRLADDAEARRIWRVSEELTGLRIGEL